jgi:hypothetical protein
LLLNNYSAMAAQLAGSKTVSMPIFGGSQKILDVWKWPDGHLVFEFFYREGSRSFYDLYDTRAGKRLFPEHAEEMAHSPGSALQRSLRPKSLTKIEHSLFSISGPTGESVSEHYEGGSLCGTQYSSPIAAVAKDGTAYRFAIYEKSNETRIFNSPCGGGEVRLHYIEASLRFLKADNAGFWALLPDQSAVARFNWNGKSAFFAGRDDPVSVPYDEMDRVRAHEDGGGPDQKAYDQAERLIQRYSRRQLSVAQK